MIPDALPQADLAVLGFEDLDPADLARAWQQVLGPGPARSSSP